MTNEEAPEIKALEERLLAARAKKEREELSAKITDPGMQAAFVEGQTEAPGYQGIQPAPDPDEPVEDEPEEEPDGVTAFIVLIGADGSAVVATDLKTPLNVIREATLLDVRRACDELLFNLHNQAVSEATVMLMHQTTQQMAEQQRTQRLQQKLASKGIQPGR